MGEAVAGVVVAKSGIAANEDLVAELQSWVRTHMRSSRVPERLEFWDELPYNETGKLLRRVVKARLLEPKVNVRSAYPLLYVDDIEQSLAFYAQLGFTLTERWDPDGALAWCSLAMEGAQSCCNAPSRQT